MAKSKYDFILDLLQYEKLTFTQKERILKLSAQEIKNDNIKDEEMRKSNEEAKQLRKQNSTATNNQPPMLLPKYVDSKNLYTFLKDYNTDPILKTTCHEIDGNELENILEYCQIEKYEFDKHREKVQERFKEFINDSKYFIDYKIKNLMYVYITGRTYEGQESNWTDDRIYLNWNSESLVKWCFDEKNKIPHPDRGLYDKQGGVEYKIRPSIETKILGKKKLSSFSDVVLHFKYLFHLRAEMSLFEILKRINDETEAWKTNVRFEIDKAHFQTNFEFFTNVEKLIQSYRILINLIIDTANKNKFDTPIVKLSLLETTEGMEFSVHHKNSAFIKSIQNLLERDGSTFSNLVKHQINGLCDLYINADFGNKQYAEINIWDGNPRVSKPLQFFEGVEYKMKFKK